MKNKTTIIELLIKKSKGEELPERIKVFDREFAFDNEYQTYIYHPCYEHEYLFSDEYTWEENLNEEVEIIEDKSKKIKKLEVDKEDNDMDFTINGYLIYKEQMCVLAYKLNEIIDKINSMEEK